MNTLIQVCVLFRNILSLSEVILLDSYYRNLTPTNFGQSHVGVGSPYIVRSKLHNFEHVDGPCVRGRDRRTHVWWGWVGTEPCVGPSPALLVDGRKYKDGYCWGHFLFSETSHLAKSIATWWPLQQFNLWSHYFQKIMKMLSHFLPTKCDNKVTTFIQAR